MIRFMVEWRTEALADLAGIWLSYPRRDEIARSSTALELELATDAHKKGENIVEDLRKLSIGPLRAYYEVYLADRRVRVSRIIVIG